MPMFHFSQLGDRLYQALYDCGFVSPEADQARGKAVLADPAELQAASLPDICGALTFIARAERFCEGTFEEAWRTGRLVAVLHRLGQLTAM